MEMCDCIYRKISGVWWTNELDEEGRIAVWETCQGILVSSSVCRITLMLRMNFFMPSVLSIPLVWMSKKPIKCDSKLDVKCAFARILPFFGLKGYIY